MNKKKIYVDGGAGTTGLRIRQRLASQPDIDLVSLPEEQRKDFGARLQMVGQADLSILCLPDAAAAEIAAAASPGAKIVDASTAHRTNHAWAYGFAELAGQRSKIQTAARVAVPGCHATGFLALAAPLVQNGWLPPSTQLSCHSLTGYSGGGKQMIAEYKDLNRPAAYNSPREYGLGLTHKHLPEMATVSGLVAPPLFCPIVADYYSGMLVTMPVPVSSLAKADATPQDVAQFYAEYYAGEALVTVHPYGEGGTGGFIAAGEMADKDSIELFVLGSSEQILLATRFDNLGKGASGAAIQCMNIMLGRPETAGLVV